MVDGEKEKVRAEVSLLFIFLFSRVKVLCASVGLHDNSPTPNLNHHSAGYSVRKQIADSGRQSPL